MSIANPDIEKTIRRSDSWFIPDWRGLRFDEIPEKYPRLKFSASGIINFSTGWVLFKPRGALNKVARDLMKRLSVEIKCDAAPIDDSQNGEAWIEIHERHPIGCVTVCMCGGDRFILGAWVHPKHRRNGVMKRLWDSVCAKHGRLPIVLPTREMRNWMKKHSVD